MSEKPNQTEVIPEEWKDTMRRGIEDAIANYELAEIISFDPFTVSAEADPRIWDQVSEAERQWILNDLFYRNSFDKQSDVVVDTYNFESTSESTWSGQATVKVYQTKRSKLENMYLHEISRPNCPTEYIVAPKEFRL